MTDYLYHHGIKGMKWGVKNGPPYPLNKDDYSRAERIAANKVRARSSKREQYDVDKHRAFDETVIAKTKHGEDVQITSVPSSRIVKFLAAHNRKMRTEAEKTRNYTISASGKRVGDLQLYKESNESMNVVWVGIDDSARGKGYATAVMIGAIEQARRAGCTQVTLEVPGSSPDARHIYEKLGFVAQEQISSDDDMWGGLTSMRLDISDTQPIVKHTALAHHGIKGMKWGVRRYQNEDGSYTEAGKKRYSDNQHADAKKTVEDAGNVGFLVGAIAGGVAGVAMHMYVTSVLSDLGLDDPIVDAYVQAGASAVDLGLMTIGAVAARDAAQAAVSASQGYTQSKHRDQSNTD